MLIHKSFDESKINYKATKIVNYNFNAKIKNKRTLGRKINQKSRFSKYLKLAGSVDYSELINKNSDDGLQDKRINFKSHAIRQNNRNALNKNSKTQSYGDAQFDHHLIKGKHAFQKCVSIMNRGKAHKIPTLHNYNQLLIVRQS